MTEPHQATPATQAPGGRDPAGAGAGQPGSGQPSSGQPGNGQPGTAWTSSGRTPLRQFLRTETGSAMILASATVIALIWSNVAPGSYGRLWATELSARVAGHGMTMDLRQFVNSGLMALFFLVVGL